MKQEQIKGTKIGRFIWQAEDVEVVDDMEQQEEEETESGW